MFSARFFKMFCAAKKRERDCNTSGINYENVRRREDRKEPLNFIFVREHDRKEKGSALHSCKLNTDRVTCPNNVSPRVEFLCRIIRSHPTVNITSETRISLGKETWFSIYNLITRYFKYNKLLFPYENINFIKSIVSKKTLRLPHQSNILILWL